MSIRDQFEKSVERMAVQIRKMPWENEKFYANWLAQQYFLVRHTPRLLCAFALSNRIENQSSFENALHHLKEENGHDQWLINDLKQLSKKPEDFKPFALTDALIKSQYYQIEHDEPASLFGYSQLLEYLSAIVAGELADRLEKKFGKKAVVFLRGHSQVDLTHAEEGWKMLEQFPSNTYQSILENLSMSEKALWHDISRNREFGIAW